MSKSSFSLFGSKRTPVVIEAPVARNYRRRAIVALFVTTGVVGLLAGTVASDYIHPIAGFLLGVAIGFTVGVAVFFLVITWPILRVLWHWLPEIGIGLGVVYGWQALMNATAPAVAVLVLALVVGVPALLRPIRRRIIAWAWCLIVRHRLRLCFARLINGNRDGLLPLILLARPTPAGERVWVWLRPGLALKELETDERVQKLAVGCWANEVRVVRASRKYAALIRVDITRREPLADTVVSPLVDYIPDHIPAVAPVSPGLPPAGLDLPDVPEPVFAEPAPGSRRKPRGSTPSTSTTDTSGFDPADYA